MKNKQLVIEWGWENLGEFELLPAITISKNNLEFKWLFFYIGFFHPEKNIFGKIIDKYEDHKSSEDGNY